METKEKREKSIDEMVMDYAIAFSLTFSTLGTLMFYALHCIKEEPNFSVLIDITLVCTTIGIFFGIATIADSTFHTDEEKIKRTKATAFKTATIILLLFGLLVAPLFIAPTTL